MLWEVKIRIQLEEGKARTEEVLFRGHTLTDSAIVRAIGQYLTDNFERYCRDAEVVSIRKIREPHIIELD